MGKLWYLLKVSKLRLLINFNSETVKLPSNFCIYYKHTHISAHTSASVCNRYGEMASGSLNGKENA